MSTSATAIPSAWAAIAASKALTISGMSEVSEPVHWDVVPSSAEASSMPYCVGEKNGFVVTWLTKTKFHSRRLREVPGGRRPATRRDAAVPVRGEGAGRSRMPAARINERREWRGCPSVMSSSPLSTANQMIFGSRPA